MRHLKLRQRHRRWMTLYGVLALVALTCAVIAAQDGIDLTRLPVGDNKTSTEPMRGYIWACQGRVEGIGGAQAQGPWFNGDGTWNRLVKITIDGAVEWANYDFSIEVLNGERVIMGNGLPPHITGIYPVQTSDDAYQYDRNPNQISEQTISFALPLNPTLAAETSCAGGTVGIMLTGILIFNGFDAELRDAAAHEVQDDCGGHPQVTGQYHYHDLSPCIEKYEAGDTHSDLVGYAFDGFGIYGFRGETGELLTNEDLDECHGHTHEIEWDGQLVEMYHYHATAEFPYTVGCFRGNAAQVGFGGMGGQGGQNGQPPQGGQGQPPQGGQGQPPQGPPPGGQGGQPPQGPPPGGG